MLEHLPSLLLSASQHWSLRSIPKLKEVAYVSEGHLRSLWKQAARDKIGGFSVTCV